MIEAPKKEIVELGTGGILKLIEAITIRQDDIRQAEIRRLDEQLINMRVQAKAESERINALRKEDIDAVAIASERAIKQAEMLATQVALNAEVLRASVAKTAETLSASVAKTAEAIATQLQQITNSLIERISALEKAQYENRGRSGISAPLLMMIAGFIGGLIVFIVESAIK